MHTPRRRFTYFSATSKSVAKLWDEVLMVRGAYFLVRACTFQLGHGHIAPWCSAARRNIIDSEKTNSYGSLVV